jgi:hypothetical protein
MAQMTVQAIGNDSLTNSGQTVCCQDIDGGVIMTCSQDELRRHGASTLPRKAMRRAGPVAVCWRVLAVAAVVLYAGGWAGAAGAQDGAAQGQRGDNEWVMGGKARVGAPVSGDLTAMGGMVDVSAAVAGHVRAAGGFVRVDAPVDGSVWAAGGRVEVLAPVRGDVRAAAGDLVLAPAAAVDGDVSVAGGTVRLEGPVGGRVRVAGGTVFIHGVVRGDVVIDAGSVQLGPEARIGGALRYTSRTPLQRHVHARIDGPVERREWVGERARNSGWMGWPHPAMDHGMGPRLWRAGGWLWSAVLLMLTGLVASLAPGLSRASAAALGERPLASVFVGLAVLLGMPIVAMLLFVTIVGIPVGLLLLSMMPLLLLIGYVFAAVALGGLVLARWRPGAGADRGWRVAAALLAMTALSLLGRLPVVGGVIAFLALLAGLGALWLQWRGGARPPAAPPGSPDAPDAPDARAMPPPSRP